MWNPTTLFTTPTKNFKMELIGKSSINPVLFYSGKILGYITWIVFVYSLFDNCFVCNYGFTFRQVVAYFTLFVGIVFTIVSLINLGKSTRLGLPSDETVLKTNGLYKISRNPMYVGFGLFTITAIIYTANLFIFIPGVYSLIVYHLIIKSEERFLMDRFGTDYENYKKRVRRYL